MTATQTVGHADPKVPLTRNQIRGFWASWGGWALDGMDSFIFALVMVPALRDLLPASGISDTPANEGFYGGLLFALFLVGWGFAFLWGPIADKFGRVRTLMLTILWYSVLTFLGAIATDVWQLAAFRFLAGIGIGGEWAMGGTFVAEEWPEDRRVWGAGLMHTGYYVGILLAGIMNGPIGGHYGWRAMFAVGGAPALIVGFIRYGVTEPKRWLVQADRLEARDWRAALVELFEPEYRTRTVLNCLFVLVSIIGLWAGSVYVPASVIHLATRAGMTAHDGTQLASYATILLSLATILGCLAVPVMANRMGRKGALGAFFAVMAISIPVTFGYVFYLPEHALAWFFVCLFFVGFGGGNFALYTLWLPEQYRTECRASAFALATSVGRFVGAGITFLVGAGVAHFHSIGIPVAITGAAFVVGLALVPFGHETRGRPLPA
jgi:MFS family permease